jgi:gamma-glutamylcyclotransferase (GGCT)/AIG2-like uncharacterized protein YtfP
MVMYLFTYGTLRRGEGLSYKLEGAGRYIGTYRTAPKYTLYDMGCPCLAPGGATSIVGDIYEVADISSVHNMEVRAGYTLERVEVDNFTEPVFAYFQTPEWNVPIISNGDWIKYADRYS